MKNLAFIYTFWADKCLTKITIPHWDFLPKFLSLHYYTHPGGCLGCPQKRTIARNYNLFVWFSVFWPKWNDIKKNLQKLSKSIKKLLFFGILSEFIQFWLENGGPNQLDELKWIILLLLIPQPSLEAE